MTLPGVKKILFDETVLTPKGQVAIFPISRTIVSPRLNNMSITASAILQAGKTAVITGASSGIGRATALACASRGMNVWMVDNDEEELLLSKDLVQKECKDASQVSCVRVRRFAAYTERTLTLLAIGTNLSRFPFVLLVYF